MQSHLTSPVDFGVGPGKKTGPSGVQKWRGIGKNREDQHTFISHTKERSRKKPGSGHSRLARRPAAGLMKHLRRGTGASVTKMRWGSADVPGPPEQNNDIITISVTDQTVHKVTGEGGLEDTHREDFPRPWMAVTQGAGAHCFSSLSRVPRWGGCPSLPGFSPDRSQRPLTRRGESEPLQEDVVVNGRG